MADANYKPRIPLVDQNSRNSTAQSPHFWSSSAASSSPLSFVQNNNNIKLPNPVITHSPLRRSSSVTSSSPYFTSQNGKRSSFRIVPYMPRSTNVAPSPVQFLEHSFKPVDLSPVARSIQPSPTAARSIQPSPTAARSFQLSPVPAGSPSPPPLVTSLEEEPFLTNNNSTNNQVTVIPDRAEVIVIRTSNLTSREKNKIFEMYNRTYRNAGYSQRFNTPAELFKKYPCIYAVKRYYTRAFVLVQHRTYYNKISAVCHNNTPLGKELMWHIIKTLLNQPGALIEASGTVSWLIRKKKLAPMITDPDIIRWALDLPNTLFEFTTNYDINNKHNQYYTRTTVIENENGDIIEYDVKTETLFGTPLGCIFEGDDCTRVCTTHIQLSNAGRRKSNKHKRKMAHKTKKHRKH